MQVLVRDNNVDQALKALKKKLQREGVFREMNWFEIAGLIAPRPVMMLQGGNDGIFPIHGESTVPGSSALQRMLCAA